MHQPGAGARSETRGHNAAASTGTAITGNGAANVEGAWADLGAATSFAYEALTICLVGATIAGPFVVDVGISDGANRFLIVEDLEFSAEKLVDEHTLQVYVPVHVAAGAQLSARILMGTASAGEARIAVIGHSCGLGGAPGFSRCVRLHTLTNARGTAIDPGGTANTKGSWAQVTASCPEDLGAMFGLIGYNADIARAATASAIVDIGIGAAASEFVLYPNAGVAWGATRDGPSNCPRIPLFACDVPKTTRIAARAACSINTAGDRGVDLALYGLVK